MATTIGILALGRPTFDVPFAEEMLARMLARLDAADADLVGPRALLMDAEAAREALDDVGSHDPDFLLILQVTFTDAAMTAEIASAYEGPLGIWSVPEPRAGGRLRLNSFCGLNLASHALSLRDRSFSWIYGHPDEADIDTAIADLLAGRRLTDRRDPIAPKAVETAASAAIAASLKEATIACVGLHPDGFDTCRYDPAALASLAGTRVETVPLDTLFETAHAVPDAAVAPVRQQAEAEMAGLAEVDQDQLDRSLRLRVALDRFVEEKHVDAFAVRCWPETFTEYGGAVCGPVAMMGERKVPCACEADVYGALTQIVLQRVADAPVFLADLVDLDAGDDTGVVWHCGQAPLSMAAPDSAPTATIHTNRKMPLLYQFRLKPGRVTFLRISQAHNRPAMVIAGGTMLDRPMAFTGTSGVVRFDTPASDLLGAVMDSGLEHHMALAYGDHRDALKSVARSLDLPVQEL
ncbi:MAG: hypothetical protein AAGL24_00505 [Pseudomonadota bacterium]